MHISGIQKNSTVDFPGLLSAVIFTPGCNYRCFYCHNKALLDGSAPLLDTEEIKSFLEKRAGLLDGVVFTGGEPTLQDGLAGFLRFAKDLGYKIKLDTNGSAPETVRDLISQNLLDYVAMDYKSPFEEYEALTGRDGAAPRRTANLLLSSGVDFELRTTLIPHIDIQELRQMAGALPILPHWILQQYIPQPGDTRHLKTLIPYTPGQVRKLAEQVRGPQPNVYFRG